MIQIPIKNIKAAFSQRIIVYCALALIFVRLQGDVKSLSYLRSEIEFYTGTKKVSSAFASIIGNKNSIDIAEALERVYSVTEKLFNGEKIRTFNGERVFDSPTSTKLPRKSPIRLDPDVHCKKWNVVTTIFEPSEAVRRATKVKGWCTVIVADTQTPKNFTKKLVSMDETTVNDPDKRYMGGRRLGSEDQDIVVFLSVKDQHEWMKKEKLSSTSASADDSTAVGHFLDSIPFRHIARKNVGYLYAIAHGAEIIFDCDDDNLLPISLGKNGKERVIPPIDNTKVLKNAAMVVTGPKAFNHHSIMGATVDGVTWPRGFPLTQIRNDATHGRIAIDGANFRNISLEREVGVLQVVADNSPDVDAIHQFIQGQPISFLRHRKYANNAGSNKVNNYYNKASGQTTEGSLLIPSHTYISYNAQATLHMRQAMFALFLPITVSDRVSDIWRAYFSQRIFREIDTGRNDGLKIVVLPPDIYRDQSEHSIFADMQAEEDLYYKTEALLEFLNDWEFDDEEDENDWAIPAMIEKLWIDLYERDYIGIADIKTMQLWLSALAEIGYDFPKVIRKKHRVIKDVVAMGQFNWAKYEVKGKRKGNNDEAGAQLKMDLLFWHQKWRQRFQKVVLRGPFPESVVEEFTTKHEIDVQATQTRFFNDRGYYSPIDNLLSVLKKYENNPKINGAMYVHDDALLNVTNIFYRDDRDRTSILLATAHLDNIPKKSTRPKIRIHPSWPLEGTANDIVGDLLYSSPDGVATKDTTRAIEMMNKWFFNDICLEGFSRVARDPRSKAYLQRDETIQGGDPFISVHTNMQSDFLYIPTRATKQYEGIAQLLLDHDVFLECAMPTIVAEVLDASKNMHFQPIGLCTSWDYLGTRGKLNMIPECKENLPPKTPLHSPYEVIHPIKINILGYSNWDRAFDWATTGILSFDLKDYA